MIKKYMTKEVVKVVGEAGYRIGKDIVREGAKVVVGKTIGAVILTAISGGGVKEIKNIKLDTILGDITRKEKKELKKHKKELRKLKELKELNELNESFRQGLVKEADEMIKDLGEESEEK